MSVQSEMDRIRSNVQSALGVIADTGVEVPAGANSDALPDAARALANAKQDKLTGTAGQVVGFDAQGNAKPQAAPQTGMTQEDADGRYLKLTGGTMNISGIDNFVFGVTPDYSTLFRIAGVRFEATSSDLEIGAGDIAVYGGFIGFVAANVNLLETESVDVPDPNSETNAANKGYVDKTVKTALPRQESVTLRKGLDWSAAPSGGEQIVYVPGILVDQTKQTVDIALADKADSDAWAECGLWCDGVTPGGALKFTCETVPTVDITVIVKMQGVQA